jgi:SAM-dependent methyltransferase
MPTVPPEPPLPAPHQARHLAESFGADPERYDRTRPRYPDALVRAIVTASPGPDLVDVGIGTGIAARQFRAAGCRVLGVEVDPRMADWARGHGLDVEVAAFEAWDPAGRTFDAVVSGQSWHWVDPVAGAAKAAEVLRPGGRLAVFWNVSHPPPDLEEAFTAVHRRVLPELFASRASAPTAPDQYSPFTIKAADGIRAAAAFGDPEEWRFDWERPYTRDEWLDQSGTAGTSALLSPADAAEVREGIAAAIDAVGGAFTMRYTAVVVTATVGLRSPA